jgi:cbb3-type cytochrome oxidase subunit 3
MSLQGFIYIGLTLVLFVIFGAIVIRVYRPGRRKQMEDPKHRMLDDE